MFGPPKSGRIEVYFYLPFLPKGGCDILVPFPNRLFLRALYLLPFPSRDRSTLAGVKLVMLLLLFRLRWLSYLPPPTRVIRCLFIVVPHHDAGQSHTFVELRLLYPLVLPGVSWE